ncbi:phosphotriesterase family protein [Pseudarthrobacter sp. S9]|uniref:phosphotriesterase family protein n=1 Tax=Pseudarthrobacter sp. S9 TaxID=3418421 RepID=UPI003CFC94CF
MDSAELGICLTHEHILNDVTSWWQPTTSTGLDAGSFAAEKVRTENLWDLKYDPFGNRDNCRLDDPEMAVEEIRRFADLGGRTIIDATSVGIGRDLRRLKQISVSADVHIVAGSGFYLEGSHPESIAETSAEDLAELIIADIRDGEDGIRPGIIGEIGVSDQFTQAERTSLIAACLAQRATMLPMQVHLPGWFRLGDEVLDLVEHYGVDPRVVVLCHMGPSGHDQAYQQRLAARGAWIQYDMIGAELYYADQGSQCPSDDDNARNIASLLDAGYGDRVLISSDIFLKSLLRRYGGPGYGHILQYFVSRLKRLGISSDSIRQLMVKNSQSLFDNCEEW